MSQPPIRRDDGRPSVCLCMIVKDEAHVIRRCLNSVLPFIDAWMISDTGSSDDTGAVIGEMLSGLPGALRHDAWQDFSHNRNLAVERARAWADYALLIDADEELVADEGFVLPPLTADAYVTKHKGANSSTVFFRPQFIRNALPWRYVGVLHEALVCAEAKPAEALSGLLCVGHFDSARNQLSQEEKYRRDAAVLEAALQDEPGNARHVFYLAQSYRDAGMIDQAVAAYERRAGMGGWGEEIWYALFQAGLLKLGQGAEAGGVAALLQAFDVRPARAEPLCALARHYRLKKQWHLAYLFAAQAAGMERPDDRLFLDDDVYAWRAADERSIAAYYTGRYQESLDLAERLLQGAALPAAQRARVAENRRFAEAKIGG